MAYLTTDLLDDLRFECSLSDQDPDYTSTRLLKMATQALQTTVYTFIIGLKQNYLVQEYLTQITSGQNFYEMAPRTYSGKLKEVKLVNNSTGAVVNLKSYSLESMQANSPRVGGIPTGFFTEDNYLILDTIPTDSTWSLLQYLYLKPSKLVLPTECATLVSSAVPGTWTISSPSGSVTTALGAGSIDIVSKNSPHNTKAYQNVIQSNPTTIVGVTGNPKAGDYVCPDATNPTIGIPEEWARLLVLATASRYFKAEDPSKLADCVGELEKLQNDIKTAIPDRIEGATQQVCSIL